VFPPGSAFYKRSPVMLVLNDGTIIRAFSAEDPDALRGYAFDGAWLDEYAAYPKQVAQDVFDQVWFCLREAANPRVIVTTTPKNLPHVRALVNGPPGLRVRITRGHTRDNAANLSAAALAVLEGRYEGTRLGRQELSGELLTDVEGALLAMEWIDRARLSPVDVPTLAATVVGVDPAVTSGEDSDETGIVVCAVDGQAHGYVLADASGKFTPEEWSRRVWLTAIGWEADAVVVEDNQGGDMVETTLKAAWLDLQRQARDRGQELPTRPGIVRVHPSGAQQSKWLRAQPVGLLYEQEPGRIHHVTPERVDANGLMVAGWVNPLDTLEDQLTTWTGAKDDESPDRVDALVHGLSWLLFPKRRKLPKGAKAPAQVNRSRWGAGARR
jgi:phage terminase large subunit-like protein